MRHARSLARADLNLLAVFMTVVECGGFSAAQAVLNLSQSTISRHMGDLEGRLGIRLCQRGRGGFRLTDKGRTVYEASQKLFVALETFRTEVGTLRGALVGELSMAVVDNWITDDGRPLAAALAAFRERAPRVHVAVHSLAPNEVERAVLDGRVELGIGVFHQHRPGLTYEPLYDDPVELYCARGHPLFDRAADRVAEADVASADYVRRGYLSEEQVAPLAARLQSTATAYQMEAVAFMILSGAHLGYLPVSYAERWWRTDRMRTVLPERYRLATTIELVWRKGVAPTAVTRAFAAAIRGRAGAAPGPMAGEAEVSG